jgi:hypothetical protein
LEFDSDSFDSISTFAFHFDSVTVSDTLILFPCPILILILLLILHPLILLILLILLVQMTLLDQITLLIQPALLVQLTLHPLLIHHATVGRVPRSAP